MFGGQVHVVGLEVLLVGDAAAVLVVASLLQSRQFFLNAAGRATQSSIAWNLKTKKNKVQITEKLTKPNLNLPILT